MDDVSRRRNHCLHLEARIRMPYRPDFQLSMRREVSESQSHTMRSVFLRVCRTFGWFSIFTYFPMWNGVRKPREGMRCRRWIDHGGGGPPQRIAVARHAQRIHPHQIAGSNQTGGLSVSRKTTFRRAIIGLLISTQVTPALLAGDLLRGMGRVLSAPIDHLHRKKPNSGQCPDLEKVAREIDWLEHYVDTYGSVVAKQPDAWGEARMTKHRREFEEQIAKRFDETKFKETLQGSLRRSDQSYLSLSLALGAAAGGNPTSTTVSNSVTSTTPAPSNATSDSAPAAPGLPAGALPATRTETAKFFTDTISLEPTVVADQLARYLNHLNEIRRINEGDDTADSPGYALNLLRIPVSVLPGKKTDQGYGAEITFTAQPHLSDDLLPTTVRNLIVNDASDMLALPLAMYLNNDRKEVKEFIKQFRESEHEAQLLMSRVLSQERLANADQALRINASYLTSQTYSIASRQ